MMKQAAVLLVLVVGCRFDLPTVSSFCGDGEIDPAEECDDGNLIDGDGCDRNCTLTACGNGVQTAGEQCDDGNATNGDGCSEDCTSNETCGNRVVNQEFGEVCDDGNATCGSCNATCSAFASAKATGTIEVVPASGIADGEMFILNDGINPAVAFEFDLGGSVGAGRVPVLISQADSSSVVRDRVINAVNSVGNLLIVASVLGTTTLRLIHERFTVVGNQSIIETVTNVGFIIVGMNGGAGGDCAAAQPCQSDADCLSNLCTASNACE